MIGARNRDGDSFQANALDGERSVHLRIAPSGLHSAHRGEGGGTYWDFEETVTRNVNREVRAIEADDQAQRRQTM